MAIKKYTYRRLNRGCVRDEPARDDCGIHCVDRDDTSPTQLKYESRCGWCWLGAPHTQDSHDTYMKER